LNTIS